LIWVFKGINLTPEWVKTLRLVNRCPFFIYHPDHPFIPSAREWSQNIVKAIPFFDCHLVFGKFLIPLLLQNGAPRAEHLPCAYDPELIGPVPPESEDHPEFECDIGFAGTWDPEREHWLSLLAQRFRVSIWGNEWENCRDSKVSACWKQRPLYGQDFAKMCRTTKLSFNFVRTENNSTSHNMRTFEIPACGGLAFTNRTEEQIAFFKEDKEIVCFGSESEMFEKAKTLLANPARIAEMKSDARVAGKAHTYQKRAAQVCDLVQQIPVEIGSIASEKTGLLSSMRGSE
jgi:spore maturation protein CgeB